MIRGTTVVGLSYRCRGDRLAVPDWANSAGYDFANRTATLAGLSLAVGVAGIPSGFSSQLVLRPPQWKPSSQEPATDRPTDRYTHTEGS